MPEPAADQRQPGPLSLAFAWIGGTAFTLSLVVFLYVYEVSYRADATASTAGPAAVDIALFTVFALHHSAFARTGTKEFITRAVPSWLERSVYTWVASLLFLVACTAWRQLPGTIYTVHGALRVGAYLLQAVGILLTALASAAIDVLDLAGVRQVLDARSHTARRHVPLETAGVYRFVRHPLYFGWAVFVFATPDLTATRLLFATVSTAYLAMAIPLEEGSLVSVFGDEYRAYQQRTRWRMVPGIW